MYVMVLQIDWLPNGQGADSMHMVYIYICANQEIDVSVVADCQT